MSRVIRIPANVYSRIEQHAKGFDTPANVIENLLNYYEGVVDQTPEKISKSKKYTTKYYFKNQSKACSCCYICTCFNQSIYFI